MNTRILLRCSIVALVVCFASLTSHVDAQRDSKFMKDFRRAAKAQDEGEMTRLVKTDTPAAIEAIVETCVLIGEGSSDELESDIEGLGDAWRAAFSNDFVSGQYEYFSLLSPAHRRHRLDLSHTFKLQSVEFEKARDAKDKVRLPPIGREFLSLAKGYRTIGDSYMSSVCFMRYGDCFDEELLGKSADFRQACSAFGDAWRQREAAGLNDDVLARLKKRFDELEFDGFGDASKGPEARAAARALADPSFAPHPLELTYQVVPDLDKIQRPLYGADSIYQIWTGVNLGGPSSSVGFPAMKESPDVIRESAAKATVDMDGDGAGDISIPLTGTIELVTIKLGDGDEERDWSFLATVGKRADTYQGIENFNLEPGDESMVIYVAPAASMVGEIEGVAVQIYDDNMDGIYGGPGLPWAFIGLVGGAQQWEVDSIRVGKSKRALPWSELVKIGKEWYRFEHGESATEVIVAKTEVDTGTFKLEMKGPSVDYLILRGQGNNEGVFVDVAASKKGVEVPVGSYELYAGRVSKGKGEQMMKALIVPGSETATWSVDVGGTTAVKLGAPFGFDFSITQNDNEVTVDGDTLCVTGRADELYQRLWNCVPRPQASERTEGAKKGGKGVKMRPNEDQQELANLGWKSVWFPMDATLKKKKKGSDSEVQMTEKKNKLFGKITSDWKGQ